FIEYWIDVAKAWRSLLALPTMESRVSPRAGIGSNIEPLPILFQGTMVGSGAQGRCEETMSISAITGLWPGRGAGAHVVSGALGVGGGGGGEPLELGKGVLVGHRGVAEGRAVVAHVAPVVK